MEIRGDSAYIRLNKVKNPPVYPPPTGDLCCSIKASCRSFRGQNSTIWFSNKSVQEFILGLRQLEKTRQGEARLTNQNSGNDHCDTLFSIRTITGLGHLALRLELMKQFHSEHSQKIDGLMNGLIVEFELRPDLFAQTVQEMIEFFEA